MKEIKLSYRTSEMAEVKESIMGDTRIWINLLAIVGNDSKGKYLIKHGNYYPKDNFGKASYDSFYIDGRNDGFPNGFQTLKDVELFLNKEVEDCKEKVTQALISNDGECEAGVPLVRRKKVLKAWELFLSKFLDAKSKGKIVTHEEAQEAYRVLNS